MTVFVLVQWIHSKAMSVGPIDEGTDKLLGVLLDPQISGADANHESRKSVRLTALGGLAALIGGTALAFVMFEDSGRCDEGTHSGLPFNLIHKTASVYDGLMALTFLGGCTAWCYPIAAARKPRPRFLHVAGSYLMVNALTNCCSVATTWAGCASHQALGFVYHFVRVPTAFLSLVGTAASFVLLQYCILSKVEALEDSGATIATGHARALFKILLNPCTIGFGMISAIIPMGIVRSDSEWFLFILYSQAVFIVVFMLIFVIFSLVAVTTIMRCYKNLGFCSLDSSMKGRLRRLLLIHALATLGANGTTVYYYITVAMVVMQKATVDAMFQAYAIDNVCNVFCAFTLSGLVGAVFGGSSLVPLPAQNRKPGSGVVETLEFAAKATKGVNAIGCNKYNDLADDY